MSFQPSERLLELFADEERGNRSGAARIAHEILAVTASPDERMICAHIALLEFMDRVPESAMTPGSQPYIEMRDLLTALFQGYESADPETRHQLENWPNINLAGLRRMLDTMRANGSLQELMVHEMEQSMTADERLQFANRQFGKSLMAWVVIIVVGAVLVLGCVGVCTAIAD